MTTATTKTAFGTGGQAPAQGETSDERPVQRMGSERYQITDMEGVRWYLKKLLEKDTLAAAIKAEAEQVAANYAAMIEQIETDKRGLEFLYAAQVREVAKTGEPLPGFEFKPSEERFSIRKAKAQPETTTEESA